MHRFALGGLLFTEKLGEDVANYIKSKDICKLKGKVVELVTLILGGFSIDLESYFFNWNIINKRKKQTKYNQRR